MAASARQHELDLLARAVENLEEAFAKKGLGLHVDFDFATRLERLKDAQDWPEKFLPIADVKMADIDERNGFWVRIQPIGSTEIVASFITRVYANCAMPRLFQEAYIITEGGAKASDHIFRLTTDQVNHVRGNLAYLGGGWVHPDYRGLHIPILSLNFMQALLLRDYGVDYSFGLLHHHHVEKALGIKSYHFRHIHRGVDWDWPGRPTMPMWLHYNTRADILAELEQKELWAA